MYAKCPYCGGEIDTSFPLCKFCNGDLTHGSFEAIRQAAILFPELLVKTGLKEEFTAEVKRIDASREAAVKDLESLREAERQRKKLEAEEEQRKLELADAEKKRLVELEKEQKLAKLNARPKLIKFLYVQRIKILAAFSTGILILIVNQWIIASNESKRVALELAQEAEAKEFSLQAASNLMTYSIKINDEQSDDYISLNPYHEQLNGLTDELISASRSSKTYDCLYGTLSERSRIFVNSTHSFQSWVSIDDVLVPLVYDLGDYKESCLQ
jgi:hypothetical protein